MEIESEKDSFPMFYTSSASVWQDWLLEHNQTAGSVWLVFFWKKSQIPSLSIDEAIDESLWFGWVDGKPNKRDYNSFYLYCSKRKPKSNWSKVNKDKVERLAALGKIATAGWKIIELAKQIGTWEALNPVYALLQPDDLILALECHPIAKGHWVNFPPSVRRGIFE